MATTVRTRSSTGLPFLPPSVPKVTCLCLRDLGMAVWYPCGSVGSRKKLPCLVPSMPAVCLIFLGKLVLKTQIWR